MGGGIATLSRLAPAAAEELLPKASGGINLEAQAAATRALRVPTPARNGLDLVQRPPTPMLCDLPINGECECVVNVRK